jgi:hypothetical protein
MLDRLRRMDPFWPTTRSLLDIRLITGEWLVLESEGKSKRFSIG